MKILFVLIFSCFCALQLSAQKITIVNPSITLPELFTDIRKQSGYDFLYNDALMQNSSPLSIKIKNATIREAMDAALSGHGLSYTIEDKIVMITEKKTPAGANAVYSISGTVTNTRGETLPGAAILVSNYQRGAVADSAGAFKLSSLNAGRYTLLIRMIGYVTAEHTVTLDNKDVKLKVSLEEDVNVLREVVIKPDQYWLERFKVFKANFLGTSPNASRCKISNARAISFEYDDENRILKANADDFIVIENKALGYRIKYFLKYFERDEETQVVRFFGYPVFEELEASRAKRRRYEKRRKAAYFGSPQHFFSTLFDDTYKQQGFLLNRMKKAGNPDKLPDSVISRKISMFEKKVSNRREMQRRTDSLIKYQEMKLAPDTVEVLIRGNFPTHKLVKWESGALRRLSFSDALYVTYKREKETRSYTKHSGYKITRPKDLARYQVSLAYRVGSDVYFYENGAIYNPASLLYEGMWGYEKVADMLPLDYTLP